MPAASLLPATRPFNPNFGRWLSRLGLVMLGAMSLGANCVPQMPPVPEVTFYVKNLQTGTTFEKTVGRATVTYGWDSSSSGDDGTLLSAVAGTAAVPRIELGLTGNAPRELIVINDPATTYVSVPGMPKGVDPDIFNRIRGTLKPAQVRLVQHGTCSYNLAFTDLFQRISRSMSTTFLVKLHNAGPSGSIRTIMQPRFAREAGVTDPTANEDGFSIGIEANASVATAFDGAAAVATYTFGMENGLPTLTATAHTSTDVTNTLWDIIGDNIGPQLEDALANTIPTSFRQSVEKDARTILYSVNQDTGDIYSALCVPKSCGGREDHASWAKEGRRVLGAALNQKGGVDAAEADRIVGALPDSDFGCVADPRAAELNAYGLVTFTPNFQRVIVMPDHVELVWYEDGAPPSPDYLVASKLGPLFGAPPSAFVCQGPLPHGGATLPTLDSTATDFPSGCDKSDNYCRPDETKCPIIEPGICALPPYHIEDPLYCPLLQHDARPFAACSPNPQDRRGCPWPTVCKISYNTTGYTCQPLGTL